MASHRVERLSRISLIGLGSCPSTSPLLCSPCSYPARGLVACISGLSTFHPASGAVMCCPLLFKGIGQRPNCYTCISSRIEVCAPSGQSSVRKSEGMRYPELFGHQLRDAPPQPINSQHQYQSGMIRWHRRDPVLFTLTQLAYSRQFPSLRSLRQLLCFTSPLIARIAG